MFFHVNVFMGQRRRKMKIYNEEMKTDQGDSKYI